MARRKGALGQAAAAAAKRALAHLVKATVRAILHFLAATIGPIGCLGFLVLLMAGSLVAFAFAGTFPEAEFEPEKADQLKASYVDAADRTVTKAEEEPYKLPWGLLASIDSVLDARDEGGQPTESNVDDNVNTLKPLFTYNQFKTGTIENRTTIDEHGVETTEVVSDDTHMQDFLVHVSAYDAQYHITVDEGHSVDTVYNDDGSITAIERWDPQAGLPEKTPDYSRFWQRCQALGMDEGQMLIALNMLRGYESPPMEVDPDSIPFDDNLIMCFSTVTEPYPIADGTPMPNWVNPLPGAVVTSPFGYRADPYTNRRAFHSGADLALPFGTPVYAAHAGTVTSVAFEPQGYGNVVRVDGDDYGQLYGHLAYIQVTEGQVLKAGDPIGRLGSSGRSTGPHTHFEVHRGGYEGTAIDPLPFISQK
jgi:hypothetical protein